MARSRGHEPLEPANHSFASDNVAGIHPHVIEALIAANTGSAGPYGDGPWTRARAPTARDAPTVAA
jgi:threonine aldolase